VVIERSDAAQRQRNGRAAATWFLNARECAPSPQGRPDRPSSTISPVVGRRRRPTTGFESIGRTPRARRPAPHLRGPHRRDPPALPGRPSGAPRDQPLALQAGRRGRPDRAAARRRCLGRAPTRTNTGPARKATGGSTRCARRSPSAWPADDDPVPAMLYRHDGQRVVASSALRQSRPGAGTVEPLICRAERRM
jgi:hypothetical protein